MADFIAVIRRAVDGLSDNTPEMRIRVYDRARSAVKRQLDNMKPRPADDVISRQLEKLDEAIATIESEFTGAPAVEPPAAAPLIVEEAPPPPATPEPEPKPEPDPAPRYVAQEPIAQEPPPFLKREPVPVFEERVEPRPEPVSAPEPEAAPEPAFPEVAPPSPASARISPEDDTMPPPAAAEPDTSWRRDRFDEPLGLGTRAAPTERAWPSLDREATLDRPDSRFGFEKPEPAAATTTPASTPVEPWNPAVTDNPFHEPAEIFTPKAEPEPVARRDAPVEPEKLQSAPQAKSWWDDVEAPKAAATFPAALGSATRDTSWDSFEAFVGERSGAKPAADVSPAAAHRGRDGMSIIGAQEPTRDAQRDAPAPEEREGRGRLIAGIAAALIVLAGVGYTGWRFSDNILGFVNGLSSSTSQTASKSQPATGQPTPSTATKPSGNTTTPPAAPVATGPQKFTQRLMADGSEVDSGTPAEQVASAAQAEGKSVANQNEKPTAPPASTQAPAPTQPATTPAATTQPDAASTQQAAPVKMFLYEERLGQASPTALEGAVTWSVKSDDQDGHKEKMIQGDISVPGRKMSAIFTLRKNNDPTLPASHIIELTFSLPKEFEGRGIESVLRISLKDKEQEQGDALVAVPAKITDYFHMIALNAFADAVKTNLNLLKTRDWIDIPVTYSNGRRALLTLQKGPDGQRVFDEVISSWQASGDSAVPAPATPPAQ